MTHFQRLQIWLASIPTLKLLWETKAGGDILQCWTDDKTGKLLMVQVYADIKKAVSIKLVNRWPRSLKQAKKAKISKHLKKGHKS
jgi:hypothetical protein